MQSHSKCIHTSPFSIYAQPFLGSCWHFLEVPGHGWMLSNRSLYSFLPLNEMFESRGAMEFRWTLQDFIRVVHIWDCVAPLKLYIWWGCCWGWKAFDSKAGAIKIQNIAIGTLALLKSQDCGLKWLRILVYTSLLRWGCHQDNRIALLHCYSTQRENSAEDLRGHDKSSGCDAKCKFQQYVGLYSFGCMQNHRPRKRQNPAQEQREISWASQNPLPRNRRDPFHPRHSP